MQRAIAINPNTPTRCLIELAYLFPEEFFNNPVYDLLALENINFASCFEKKVLLKLVAAPNAPESFLQAVSKLEKTQGICNIVANHFLNHYRNNFNVEVGDIDTLLEKLKVYFISIQSIWLLLKLY